MKDISRQMRRWIVEMTTEAGSGHPTSSLSAVELMTTLFFSEKALFRYDSHDPEYKENDRLIFSKGHASPLFYSLWAGTGAIDPKELMSFRKFESRLEGHPTRRFPYTEVPTGSLGQGLGVGVGEALALRAMDNGKRIKDNYTENPGHSRVTGQNEERKTDTHSDSGMEEEQESGSENYPLSVVRSPHVFVLLGDSEIAEGSVWESVAIATQYRLNNLIAIVDANRLGQRGETLDGWDIATIAGKFRAFGWEAIEVEDGHDIEEVEMAYERALKSEKPVALIAKTIKGRCVSSLENAEGWHGKVLSREDCEKALGEIGEVPDFQPVALHIPESELGGDTRKEDETSLLFNAQHFALGDLVATRKVYGRALLSIAQVHPHLVVLDAEVSNSTYSAEFGEEYPERFYEMYVAEQNMVSTAVGMARRGMMPFVSTFGAFFTRAFDQIRMAQYADVNVTFVGSHVGVSIGDDGASQMGLEDMAMFRAINESTVLYPSDAVSMMACIRLASEHEGITYVRTTRAETPVLYGEGEEFMLGGSKTVRESEADGVTVITAGVTVSEALKAYEQLQKEGMHVRVIDAYSIKPIDKEMIVRSLKETRGIIVVEDHYPEGGLGSAVREAVCEVSSQELRNSWVPVVSLAVRKRPRSGTPEELLRYEEIDAQAIVKAVKNIR